MKSILAHHQFGKYTSFLAALTVEGGEKRRREDAVLTPFSFYHVMSWMVGRGKWKYGMVILFLFDTVEYKR